MKKAVRYDGDVSRSSVRLRESIVGFLICRNIKTSSELWLSEYRVLWDFDSVEQAANQRHTERKRIHGY